VVIDLGCGTGLCGPIFRDVATRLVGVDISLRMIERARDLGVYDELRVEDLRTTLRTAGPVFDLAVAADVLVYFGDLAELFVACGAALPEGGRFAFTTESTDAETDFALMPGGRFAHGRRYIEAVAAEAGFCVERYSTAVLRLENGQPINSHVYVVRRGPITSRC
jgi:predicted TPR repeat methyltransferase